MTEDSAVPSLVFDCGAHHLRAGYGGEHGPRLDVPALVGYPRHRGVAMAAGMNELAVGEDALLRRGLLTTVNPVRNGLVDNWEGMEHLWSHVLFEELRVNPETYAFIAVQCVNAPAAQKERTLELMMETFHVNSLYLATSQVLSAYAYGVTTGLVLDSGLDATLAVPVYEGYALGRHVASSAVAGDVLTSYLAGMLKTEGYSLSTPVERDLVSRAKEAFCYVRPYAAPPSPSVPCTGGAGGGHSIRRTGTTSPHSTANGETEVIAEGSVSDGDGSEGGGGECLFELPDGQVIPLDEHRHRTTEVLFNFSLLNSDALYAPKYKVLTEVFDVFTPSLPKGISWLPFAAISSCGDSAIQHALYANICLAGNNVAFPGLRDRLEREITQLYRENHSSEAVMPITVRDLANARGYSAWLGGSILSQMDMFRHMVVSRQEYEETGARVVHCKQF